MFFLERIPDYTSTNDPLPPVRGLIPLQNRKGKSYAIRDIHRWLHYLRYGLKIDKVDLLARAEIPSYFPAVLRYASTDTFWSPEFPDKPTILKVSLRTICTPPPEWFANLKNERLFDVLLTPASVDDPNLVSWFEIGTRLGVPLRLQLQPPFPEKFDMEAFCERAATSGLRVVTIRLGDPFVGESRPVSASQSRRTLEQIQELVRNFAQKNIETNLYDIPLCLLDEDVRHWAGGRTRFFRDHQQYNRRAYRLAEMLYRFPPRLAGLALIFLLVRNRSYRPVNDTHLIHWLMVNQHHTLYSLCYLLAKTLRRKGLLWGETSLLEDREHTYLDELEELFAKDMPKPSSPCASCSLSRVCDRETNLFRRVLPGLSVKPLDKAYGTSVYVSLKEQTKYFDAVDLQRLRQRTDDENLAREAAVTMTNSTPTPLSLDKVIIHKTFFTRMPGAYRYYAFTDREHLSTLAFWGEVPFTLSATFGGGMAELAGFCIWDTIRIVCPMVGPSHQIVLHASADGRYVLLRDGEPVRPAEFRGKFYLPQRMPTFAQVKFSLWDIQGDICLQNLQVWQGVPQNDRRTKIRFSFLIVTTRFSRRLQATLQSIASQKSINSDEVEVIVAYVPGLDATEDVLHSIRLTYPQLRILQSPFPEECAHAKGFMINRSVPMASGDWVILLDSDIVVSPDMCAQLASVPSAACLAAPIGRKMIPPEQTAKILLGEIRPWSDWDSVITGPGENRFGDKREGGEIPVGFCQCVKKACFDEIKYNEYEHFEGADWEFAHALVQKHGACVWLASPVLHLDHGGSQWFGTRTHR